MFTLEQGLGCKAVLRFSGALDAASALEVRPFLASAAPGNITLDFSQASSVDYYGLSVLISEMQAQGGMTVLLRGLRLNQIRMLRYFGLDPARFGLDDGGAPAPA
jgi:anti-anti-sigma regulatory factor